MSLQIVIDMNLSPDWASFLRAHGWSASHWSSVGDPRAADTQIMNWALINAHVVFTNDFDFPTLLALTRATGPSVIQLRGIHLIPSQVGPLLLKTLRQQESVLESGALVIIDQRRSRVRILPL